MTGPSTPGSPSLVLTVAHAAFDAERQRALSDLLRRLGAEVAAGGVPEGFLRGEGAYVARDHERRGCWLTVRDAARQGLLAAEVHGATHVALLADDVRPCEGFLEALANALTAVDDRPIVLMAMGDAARKACGARSSWVQSRDAIWGGATVWPVPMLRDFLAWERTYVSPLGRADGLDYDTPDREYRHDDGRMAAYLRALGVSSWLSAPSLLSHRGDEVRSVMGKGDSIGGKPKVAGYFAGEGDAPDAREVDWSLGTGGEAGKPYAGAAGYVGPPTKAVMRAAAARMLARPWRSSLTTVPGRTPAETRKPFEPLDAEALRTRLGLEVAESTKDGAPDE